MKLLINEFIKDYKKKTTWVYMILIIAMLAFYNFARTYNLEGTPESSAQTLIAESLSVTTGIAYIFILIMFANNLSQEYSKGTIKFLYSKPKSRTAILTAKIILAFFNFVVFSVVSFVADILMKKYIFYKNYINLHTVFGERLGEEFYNRTLLEHSSIFLGSVAIVVIFMISLVLLICTVAKTQILSLVVVMFMVLAGDLISNLSLLVMGKFEYIKYIFTNISKIPGYFTEKSFNATTSEIFKLGSSDLLIMALSWTVLFMIISYVVNARRDITLD